MINRHFHPGKKTLAARRVAGLLMSGAAAGAMAVSGAGAYIVSAASWQENANRIFDYLTQDLGYTEAAACGIMANIRCESTFNPQAWNAGGGSYGLCQWTGGRYSRLRSWCGSNGFDYTTIEGQLAYLEYELNAHYPGVEEYLRSVDNTAEGAYEAGQYYCYHFEAPASRGSVSVYRGGLARGTFWETYRPAEWYKVDGVWHYILRDGSYQTEWLTIEDETFYLDEEGRRITGWRTIDGNRYYFADDGVMVTGWHKIDGKSYYFGQDGSLVTGLVHSGDDWFLLDQTGNVQASAAMEAFAPVWIAEAQERDAVLAETEPEETETLASASQESASASQDSLSGSPESPSASASLESASASQEPSPALLVSTADQTATTTAPTAIEALQQAANKAAGRTQEETETASASAHAVSAMTEEAATMAVAEALASAANATSTAVPEMSEYADSSVSREEDSSVEVSSEENNSEEDTSEMDSSEMDSSEEALSEENGDNTDNREETPEADTQETESASFASAAEAMLAAAQSLQENKNGNAAFTEDPQEDLSADTAVKTEEETAESSASMEEETEDRSDSADSEEENANHSDSVDSEEKDTEQADSADSEKDDTEHADSAESEKDDTEQADSADSEKEDSDQADSADSDSVDGNDEEGESLRIRFIWVENYEKDREKEKGKGFEKEIPSISIDEIDDLVSILHDRELLLAETRQGTDITSEVKADFEEEVKRPGDYTVTFRVEHAGETIEKETTIHIVK